MATNSPSMNETLVGLQAAFKSNEGSDRNFHIMFIGASGAGKTSLLNFIGLLGAMYDHGFDMRIISEFKPCNDVKLERDQGNPMASKTSRTKSYDVKFGSITLKITDTPGLGMDTAGIGKEKEHVKNIVDYLITVDYVDCICLVVNGRTPRSFEDVKYAFSEISAILPDVTNSNTIIYLTNVESFAHATIDLEAFNGFFKREIQREKTFCLDNPLCHLQRANKIGQTIREDDVKRMFETACTEFKGVLLRIKSFNPLPTTLFTEIYKAKQAVERDILTITVHQHNLKQLELKMKQVTKKDKSLKFEKLVVTEDQHYNTLCDHPECYSNCHLRCQLPLSFDTEVFKGCYCMVGSSTPGVCAVCKHSYAAHYHHYVRFDRQEINDKYKNIIDQITKENDQALQTLSANIHNFEEKSSVKNYLGVVSTQLDVVRLYIRVQGDTKVLKKAESRLELALQIVPLSKKRVNPNT